MLGENPVTIAEAAKQLKVSRQTLYSWIEKGDIEAVTLKNGRQGISQSTLDYLLKIVPPAEQREMGISLLYEIVKVRIMREVKKRS